MPQTVNQNSNTLPTPRAASSTAQRSLAWAAVMAAAIVAGCKTTPLPPPPPGAPAPAPVYSPAPPTAAPSVAGTARSMADYRRRAAQMIMAANPTGTFSGPVPDPLYGIVVVTIALNADGSLKSTNLMRRSSVGPEVNNMAIDAVRRVGNFGAISNLPGPWEFNETFFYNDARKFQLVTLVERR